jgi:hypothetical protein
MQARSSVHLGNAGEHLVMAHLLGQGFQAFMADRGNPAFDISVVDGHRHSLIRVKTTSSESVMWSRKPSGVTFLDLRMKGDYCCIVDMRNGVARAEFYLVPTNVVQEAIDEARAYWVAGTGRDGKPHQDSSRQVLSLCERDGHPYRGFRIKWSCYRDNWESLRGRAEVLGDRRSLG